MRQGRHGKDGKRTLQALRGHRGAGTTALDSGVRAAVRTLRESEQAQGQYMRTGGQDTADSADSRSPKALAEKSSTALKVAVGATPLPAPQLFDKGGERNAAERRSARAPDAAGNDDGAGEGTGTHQRFDGFLLFEESMASCPPAGVCVCGVGVARGVD